MTLETAAATDRRVPFDEAAEQHVLGCLLTDRDAIFKIADLLRVDDFYLARHQRVYAAAQALLERRERIDPITIQDELARREELDRAGDPVGVPRARLLHRGLHHRRPHRPRGTSVGREDEPRPRDGIQHGAPRASRSALLARDGREADRVALPRAQLAHGPAGPSDREHHRHRRGRGAARPADPHRRHAWDLDHGAAHEGAPREHPREGRRHRRRLPAARPHRRRGREPRARDRDHHSQSQSARARAGRGDHRTLAALSRRGRRRRRAEALDVERRWKPRAGQRPGGHAVARSGGDSGGRAATHQRQHREEPQRSDGNLPAALRERAGAVLLEGARRRRTAGMTLEVARGIKPPPEKPEAEASLLGAMLMDGSIYNEVARGRLAPADLSREQHRLVLAAIARVAERSEAVGFASVQSDLAARDEVEAIGGPQFLVSLMQNVPTVAHAETYAAIVERTALLRRLIGVANEIARLALTREESTAAVSDAQELLFAVSESTLHRDIVPLDVALRRYAEQIDARGDMRLGIRTGIESVDKKTGGLQASDLILIAGRPGLGKTSLALNVVEHAAVVQRKTCAFFSLEAREVPVAEGLGAAVAA